MIASESALREFLGEPSELVRAKVIEYVQEKASGFYGHNKTQLRRFTERLSARAVTTVYRKDDYRAHRYNERD